MCVLQPCSNPTEVGVWWRDDTQWCRYSLIHQALIRRSIANQLQQIDLGTIVSTVHPTGARYVVNLRTMEQVALSSGQRRPIMVIDPVSVQTPQLEAPPQLTRLRSPSANISLQIHYRDGQGTLHLYDPHVARAFVQSMAASSNQSTLLVPDGRSGYFFFDLNAMEQYFVSHFVHGEPILSNKPPVKVIVEVPWDAAAMASLAAKADKFLRRKILVMVIDRFRSDEHLDAILPVQACPREIVSRMSSTCSVERFEKFVDSVEEILQIFPRDVMGEMVKTAGKKEIGNGPVQVAFKPVERSRRARADVAVTTKAAFWISMAAPAAAAREVVYGCTVQILAYLVIVPIRTLKAFGNTILSDQICVEVNRPDHQLPLAEVTVR